MKQPWVQTIFIKKTFIYLYFGCTGSQLQHTGILVLACGSWFPDQGWNPGSFQWEAWSLSHWPTREVLIKKKKMYWRIIGLQCWVSFRDKLNPSSLDSFPYRLFTPFFMKVRTLALVLSDLFSSVQTLPFRCLR